MNFNTGVGVIKLVTFDEFLKNVVSISQIQQRGQIYNMLEKSNLETNAFLQTLDRLKLYKEFEDFTYNRQATKVIDTTTSNLEKQFIDQLISANITPLKGKNLNDLIENAVFNILQNFGISSHVIKLSNTRYVVVDSDPDVICLKILTNDKGALIVYVPEKCKMVELV